MKIAEIQKELIKYIDINLESVSKPFAMEFKINYNLYPNQMSSLWYLRKFGKMTMGEYAIKMHMSKQQATKLVSTLVDRDLIVREYSKENRRLVLIDLSKDGLDIILDIEDKYTKNFMKKLKHLSDDEQIELFEAMKVINKALYKMNSASK